MANPIAVPGTNVPSGAAVSPGGAQGVTGIPAWTTCTSGFTIPAVGATVSVAVVDTSWVTIGEMLYVDQAGGSGQSGILQVTAKTANSLTLLNPTPAPAIPPADATQAGLLKQLSGNTIDFVDGTNTCQNLATAIQPTIWSATRRVFNAIGNPTFEVDQINVGGNVTIPAGTYSAKQCDRWFVQKSAATATLQAQRVLGSAIAGSPPINVPGTNFRISQNALGINLGTPQATLAAGDYLIFRSLIEGPRLRELIGDVHSVSILIWTNAPSGFQFGFSLQDFGNTRTLSKLCTVTTPSAWQLVTLPNLPLWPPSGNFPLTPGNNAYLLTISLACGTTYTAPANDTWQNGNFIGALSQGNFMGLATNTSFYVGFIQHEPGALCTTFQDCPFETNLDACLRYYQKSYPYSQAIGSAGGNSYAMFNSIVVTGASWTAYGALRFPKAMAKAPTGTCYHNGTGAANATNGFYAASGTVPNASGTFAISSVSTTAMGIPYIGSSGASTSPCILIPEWTADTGW